MRTKVLFTVAAMLGLLVVWVPSASAKASWSYGNGPQHLAVDVVQAGGLATGVCNTHITGLAGVSTDTDPTTQSPQPPLPETGFTVDLFIGPPGALSGATVVSDGLKLANESVITPTTMITARPTRLDPADHYTGGGADYWEYAAAGFAFDFSASAAIPVGDDVVIVNRGNSAYFNTTAVGCTTTTVQSSKNPSVAGNSVTLTAKVTRLDGTPVTTGSVTFTVGPDNLVFGPIPVVSGQAWTVTSVFSHADNPGDGTFQPGDYQVSADYVGGDFDHVGSSSASLTQTVTSPDTSAPLISYALSPVSPGDGGWYQTPVTLTWTVTDPESPGSVVKAGCVDQAIGSDQVKTTYSCSATSDGGSAGPQTVTVGYDATPPTLAPSMAAGSSFAVGQPAAAVTAGAQDATSGVASQSCGAVDTTSIGTRSVTCTATDNAGNPASVTRSYAVTDAFLGFSYPSSKSALGRGWTIPVTFGLGTYQGTSRATKATVRLTVTPSSQTSPPSPSGSSCTCKATFGGYLCLLKLPSTAGSYKIWAWENVGTSANPSYAVLQNALSVAGKANANPLTITVK